LNAPFQLALYSLAIVLIALCSGAIILLIRDRGHRRTEILLAFAAGVMLGTAFCQMIPEALHLGPPLSLLGIPLGALVMFFLERFVIRHSCEELREGCDDHDHASLGIVAFLCLSAHTLFDGVALGSSITAGIGGAVFVAIVAHKVPSSLALAALLVHAGTTRRATFLLLFLFALTVPLGAGLYFLLARTLAPTNFTAWVLAFSAGTFLYLALADLLPQVHRKIGWRWSMFAGLAAGLLAMGVVPLLSGGHAHG
jgi:zinc and cadmium transporter